MGGGGSSSPSNTSSTSTSTPWTEAQPYLKKLMSEASAAYDTTSKTPYTGATYAGPTQLQKTANQNLVSLANNPAFSAASNANMVNLTDTASGKYLDPAMNPTLQGAINAANAPVIQKFQEQIVPTINSDAIKSGAYGGGRQGLALGRASQGLTDSLANTDAMIVADNYKNERANQMGVTAQLPTAQTAMTAAPTLASNAGAETQGWNQAAINDAIAKWQGTQSAPWAGISELQSAINGTGSLGGTTTSTGTSGTSSNRLTSGLSSALGGGLLGYGASTMFPATLGALGSTLGVSAGAAGGGLGTMLGLLSMLSDRRFKTNIKRLGTTAKGFGLYSFEYKHNKQRSIGLMADEVAKSMPEAIINLAGIDFVNYALAL